MLGTRPDIMVPMSVMELSFMEQDIITVPGTAGIITRDLSPMVMGFTIIHILDGDFPLVSVMAGYTMDIILTIMATGGLPVTGMGTGMVMATDGMDTGPSRQLRGGPDIQQDTGVEGPPSTAAMPIETGLPEYEVRVQDL